MKQNSCIALKVGKIFFSVRCRLKKRYIVQCRSVMIGLSKDSRSSRFGTHPPSFKIRETGESSRLTRIECNVITINTIIDEISLMRDASRSRLTFAFLARTRLVECNGNYMPQIDWQIGNEVSLKTFHFLRIVRSYRRELSDNWWSETHLTYLMSKHVEKKTQ